MAKEKVGVISLGCDKNRVDTEKMLAILQEKYSLTNDITSADVVIINTCAFLKSSRQEAIDEIFAVNQLKEQGLVKKIIITGCLPQKFIDQIVDELQEVDGFLGISDYEQINNVIERVLKGERVNAVGAVKNEKTCKRVLTTDNYAYLKIADGCSNCCTYCLIPKIRGKYRSVEKDLLIQEARSLGKVQELILVAQDLTKYGEDLQPKTSLVELIRELTKLSNVKSIRLLYCYPENISDELIHEMSVNAKLIRYIDMPLQHADDRVLKLMNRKGAKSEYLALIQKLRERVKGIAIRSTFITGFVGETEEAFDNLIDFLQQAKLENAGFFKYSKEEDTPAYKLDGHLLESVKNKRLKKLYSVQRKIVKEQNKQKVGKTYLVLAEGFDKEKLTYYGRAYFSAPEIDGKIYFFSSEEVQYGSYVSVKITDFDDYDLYGERI